MQRLYFLVVSLVSMGGWDHLFVWGFSFFMYFLCTGFGRSAAAAVFLCFAFASLLTMNCMLLSFPCLWMIKLYYDSVLLLKLERHGIGVLVFFFSSRLRLTL